MAKLGFLIILLLFGGTLFLAGLMAPANIAEPVEALAMELYTRWAPKEDQTDKEISQDKPAAVDYSQLLDVNERTSPLGIQIGLFTSITQIELLHNELAHVKVPVKIIYVSLDKDIRWALLAAGPFKNREDVQLATAKLRENYGYSWSLDVIAWPEEK